MCNNVHKVARCLVREDTQRPLFIRTPKDDIKDYILACIPNGDCPYQNYYIVYVLYEHGYANNAIEQYIPNSKVYGFDFITLEEYYKQVENLQEYVFKSIEETGK